MILETRYAIYESMAYIHTAQHPTHAKYVVKGRGPDGTIII